MIIMLTDDECCVADEHGKRRTEIARQRERVDFHGCPGKNEWNDIVATRAEIAASIATGIPWNDILFEGEIPRHQPDLGTRTDVKQTDYVYGHLLVQQNALDEGIFVLAIGEDRTFSIPGWVYGSEAKQHALRSERPGSICHWVPQSALRPIETLSEAVDKAWKENQ